MSGAPSCAFGNCGRPDCPVCTTAREASAPARGLFDGDASASTHELLRADAQAEPKAAREKPAWVPKRRYRVGPHR